ncbi:hypothetical protein BT69DRAFT_1304313 [Atractiella rhizophila]|nr:hypothetical protein BT69DRAFT_1304313 [Atractiella rhizophila]
MLPLEPAPRGLFTVKDVLNNIILAPKLQAIANKDVDNVELHYVDLRFVSQVMLNNDEAIVRTLGKIHMIRLLIMFLPMIWVQSSNSKCISKSGYCFAVLSVLIARSTKVSLTASRSLPEFTNWAKAIQ